MSEVYDSLDAPFDAPGGGGAAPLRLDARVAAAFCERSTSAETRRAYRRVVREFLRFNNERHPDEITSADVLRWRDALLLESKRAATVVFKLAVVRSFFDYLRLGGHVTINPAAMKLVPPPHISADLRGRALNATAVRHLLGGPDRETSTGARDYALLLLMVTTSLRVSEACGLRRSQIRSSGGRWLVRVKVKGGRERVLSLSLEVKRAVDNYLELDCTRRALQHSDGADAFVFQPHSNYRTLEFDKPLSTTMAWRIARKWGEFTGVGKLSPHDLRRTAITRALDEGLSHQQVQIMSGHRDQKTVRRYVRTRVEAAHDDDFHAGGSDK